MKGASDNNQRKDDAAKPSAQKKKRAQAGDFDKQVHRIRHDIDKIRANLAAAEKALGVTGVPYDASSELTSHSKDERDEKGEGESSKQQ